FFSSRRRHTRFSRDWSSDVCSSDLARRRRVQVNWVQADVARLPLRGPFDAVAQFWGNLITWFADRDETLAVLKRLSSVLRPGGRSEERRVGKECRARETRGR